MAKVVRTTVLRHYRVLFLDGEIPESGSVSVSGTVFEATWGYLLTNDREYRRDATLVAVPLDGSLGDEFFVGKGVVPLEPAGA
ncbi:MAG: hypothetical protein LKE37_01510 [Atopobiaceae bacterium]|jgi:hypothetical protein|nr:hypothetical protein [Atopobiaceae bacterium]